MGSRGCGHLLRDGCGWSALATDAAGSCQVFFRRFVTGPKAGTREDGRRADDRLTPLTAGPLDRNYAATWDAMSGFDQLVAAVTGAVGQGPTLAPGVPAEMSLALLLATIRHPGLVRRP